MLDFSWLRILIFLGVWAVVWLPIALIVSRWLSWQSNQALLPQQKIALLLSLYFLSPLVLTVGLKLEELPLSFVGLGLNSQIWFDVALGLGISISSLIIIFIVKFSLGWINWHGENAQNLLPLLLPILALSLLISLVEEVVFRGYIFGSLLTDNPFWVAAIFSSVVFALLHLIWERKQTIPQLPGLWLMGMILVGARLATDGYIYLALGMHAGWVWGFDLY